MEASAGDKRRGRMQADSKGTAVPGHCPSPKGQAASFDSSQNSEIGQEPPAGVDAAAMQAALAEIMARRSAERDRLVQEDFAKYLAARSAGRVQDRTGVRTDANAPHHIFRKVGRTWKVVLNGGGEFHVVDTLGAKYLDYLLHHPNKPISAFDLEVAIQPEKGKFRPKYSIQDKLDPQAHRQYLRKLDQLRSEREQAREASDWVTVEFIEQEIEAVESATKNKGFAADTGEKARNNVQKAVAVLLRQVGKGDREEQAFGRHIQQFVATGYECIYNQPEGGLWA